MSHLSESPNKKDENKEVQSSFSGILSPNES